MWSAAAAERVEETRQALADAIAQVDASLNEWLDAKAEHETASNARMRKRPAGAERPLPRLAELRGENREAFTANDVVAALAKLPHEDEATVGQEREVAATTETPSRWSIRCAVRCGRRRARPVAAASGGKRTLLAVGEPVA